MGTIWNILMAFGALMIGLIGRAHFPELGMLPSDDPENVYPLLAQDQLYAIVFGLVVASIFAAIMSTCDSQLLVVSSAVVRDVYQKIFKKGEELPQREMVRISRAVVILLVIISLLLGFLMKDVIFTVVLFAWAGVGGAIGPVSILALFWRRTTHAGVIAGMLTGMLTTLLWYNLGTVKQLLGPLPSWLDSFLYADLYELIPAFVLSILVAVIVSLFTKKPEGAEKMFAAMKGKEEG
jgi:Na+/proline symporter